MCVVYIALNGHVFLKYTKNKTHNERWPHPFFLFLLLLQYKFFFSLLLLRCAQRIVWSVSVCVDVCECMRCTQVRCNIMSPGMVYCIPSVGRTWLVVDIVATAAAPRCTAGRSNSNTSNKNNKTNKRQRMGLSE